MASGFETLARQRKVDALVAAIPSPTNDLDAQRVANCFADMSVGEWAAFAARRGINAPSATTRAMVVERLRARVAAKVSPFCDGCGCLRRACECRTEAR